MICNRYFNDIFALEKHLAGKSHKQKLKSLKKDKPFTHEEAEAASGKGSYYKPVVSEAEKKLVEKNQTSHHGSDGKTMVLSSESLLKEDTMSEK